MARVEEWRHIRGLEVSSHGCVKKGGRTLKGDRLNTGYRRIRLGNSGRGGYEMVHRLVCEAFNGAPRDGQHALHRDDNKLNNTSDNLYWGFPKNNCEDRYWNGLSRALLDSRSVQLIRIEHTRVTRSRSRAPKGELERLARIFRVSTDVVRNAIRAYKYEGNYGL